MIKTKSSLSLMTEIALVILVFVVPVQFYVAQIILRRISKAIIYKTKKVFNMAYESYVLSEFLSTSKSEESSDWKIEIGPNNVSHSNGSFNLHNRQLPYKNDLWIVDIKSNDQNLINSDTPFSKFKKSNFTHSFFSFVDQNTQGKDLQNSIGEIEEARVAVSSPACKANNVVCNMAKKNLNIPKRNPRVMKSFKVLSKIRKTIEKQGIEISALSNTNSIDFAKKLINIKKKYAQSKKYSLSTINESSYEF